MLKYLLPILTISCTTSQQNTNNRYKNLVNAPKWTHNACKQTSNGYLFVGYGEGKNLARATRDALISSRNDALLCVFGGTYTASTEVKDTNTSSTIKSSTKLNYQYESINWSGYKKTNKPIHFTKNDDNGLYVQYFWDNKAIESERKRIDALNKQIETNRALKNQVKVKDILIVQQKKTLKKIKIQEAELKHLEAKTKLAINKLNNLQSERKSRDDNFEEFMDRLECGVTLNDVGKLLGKADKIETHTCGAKLYYGKFALEYFDCDKRQKMFDTPFNTIYTNHGAKRYKKLCNEYRH